MTNETRTCTDVRPEASLFERTVVAIDETVENIAHVASEIGRSDVPPPVGVTSRDRALALGRQSLAMFTGRMWNQGRRLTVSLKAPGTPGGASSMDVVNEVAKRFKLVDDLIGLDIAYVEDWASADIRVAFFQGQGSWSYLGTDARTIPRDKPTMNFGWLNDSASDDEFDRVAPHEFCHALGCPHEHQQPNATFIKWNKPVVYRYYAGPPNNWSKAEVDRNLFELYDRTITQFTTFDPASIMLYPIPKEFTLDGFSVGWNRKLSASDVAFLKRQYPKADEPTKPEEPAYRPGLPRNTVDLFDLARGDLFDLEQVLRGRRKRGAPMEEIGRFIPKAKDV